MNSVIDKGTLGRLVIAGLLALVALVLFLLPREHGPAPPTAEEPAIDSELLQRAAQLDRDIDTVLARFGIEPEWVRKREIPLPGKELVRWERRVAIPPDMLPIQLNLAFNAVAKRYNGRAIASENSKDNSVTIHVELDGLILQSIILKPSSQLQRPARGSHGAAA